ncbi:hypothetical protein J2Z69_002221 [Paenibacillus shirakamiensis]|uniref:Uncharacterized protein n=1 Tax=Paenibacillus shirakamiensis TaxID=1265935 RepID=A0ABS4JHK9_9BACL|nr:hypothetical protein [Paenibacillus shirakamiensis]MBP2001178.1 hypothetical protein [Paenibacillus shirakamiensis]
MPYTTGAIFNPLTGSTAASQIRVVCINDSQNSIANIELEIFQWSASGISRAPLGHNLIALQPQSTQSFTYTLFSAVFYEVQIDYYSATSAVVHVFGLDVNTNVVQRVLQSEMSPIDRLTLIP